MIAPILEPRVLDARTKIGDCYSRFLNTAFEEHMAHCRVPDLVPFDEMSVVPTITPNNARDWQWQLDMFDVFEEEFIAHRKHYFIHVQAQASRARTLSDYRSVRPERKKEPWR